MPRPHEDDPIGRLLTRRELIALLAAPGAALLAEGGLSPAWAAAGGPSCVVRPEQTEGPYFVDERLDRSDIRSDPADGSVRPGTLLALTLAVSRVSAGTCLPLTGARVDLWHCDAEGIYSDVEDPRGNTTGRRFLRGCRTTDERGEARFTTIYPGWYPGRTVHIHFKIRSSPTARPGFDFTSQLYFDDALTDRIHAAAPYAGRGPRATRNGDDWIFRRGGDQLMLAPAPAGDGYEARFAIGLQVG